MSFRKRNVVLGSPNPRTPSSRATSAPQSSDKTLSAGVRPSPLDGRPTTSTGTSSLDQLLAGHSGLPLGTSLLIEEAGTTDFSGTILRYYTAEGLVQGHEVHLLGSGEAWRRDLPGLDLTGGSRSKSSKGATASDDKMKIAWRYETLGNSASRSPSSQASNTAQPQEGPTFCHFFDLSKRLENKTVQGFLHSTPTGSVMSKPSQQTLFQQFLASVAARLRSSPPSTIHRIVVPSLLSPTLYPSSACRPQEVIQFLHGLRGLLRHFPGRATAMLSLPVSLYPRATGLTRWAELLSDGVLELIPLQHQSQMSREPSKDEDRSQGMVRAHSLPVFHEKGGALEGSWSREDLSFRLSASSGMVITPFALPPIGEEEESKPVNSSEKKKESLEF